jgi:hypothetical protein
MLADVTLSFYKCVFLLQVMMIKKSYGDKSILRTAGYVHVDCLLSPTVVGDVLRIYYRDFVVLFILMNYLYSIFGLGCS